MSEIEELSLRIIDALKTVYDPEIPANLYDLGLIYKCDLNEDRTVSIEMTLTTPLCPVAETLPEWVKTAVECVPGVESCSVVIVWEPPWTPDKMSMRAKLELNMI